MTGTTSSDRGQAYTLEGFIGAMVVLMALLFALQSVVIMPTTGGMADRTVQSQLQQETQDTLVVAATEDEGDLSEMVRYWNESGGEFYGATEDRVVRGNYNASNQTELYDEFVLGELLVDRLTEHGLSFNVELVYQDETGEFDTENSTYLVYQGEAESITASYTVTLFEDDELTAPTAEEGDTVRDAYDPDEDDSYPIPPGTDESTEVYNVVEVRIAVW